MNAMTTHIKQPGMADSLEDVLKDELSQSVAEVLGRTDWSNREIEQCNYALSVETARTLNFSSVKRDSVKGEYAMGLIYGYAGAATDSITLFGAGRISLAECKYGIKYGGAGPFRSSAAFKRDIAKKFDKMEKVFLSDHENVRDLRVLVVSREQFPFTIEHVNALKQLGLPAGDFSTDGKSHNYVLCSTTEVRKMTGVISVASLDPSECLLFNL